MSAAAIRVESLGKVYRIGGRVERYRTLRDTVLKILSRITEPTTERENDRTGAGASRERRRAPETGGD